MQEEEEAMIKREREREVKLINRLILTKIKRERRGCGQSGWLSYLMTERSWLQLLQPPNYKLCHSKVY